MVFSSLIFLFGFLPLFFLLYLLSPSRPRFKNNIILLGSLVFYAWGAPKFVFVLLGSTLIDFYLVRWMDQQEIGIRKKAGLFLSIALNLGLLLYFKYANFFFENLNELFQALGLSGFQWTHVILPIGISFYTFQTLSYSIDVYRKTAKPLDQLDAYIMYIMMFPQLIAGPIIRYNEIRPYLSSRKVISDDVLVGVHRFSIGLAKKVLIANVMGAYVQNSIGGGIPPEFYFLQAWTVILAYAFQIYFDFSGYSDMAIGLGRILGFKFPENFNNPYISRSITEFWRRWHITLSRWMKDYLYIPLGGNRLGQSRTLINLFLVFIISGLWHGAAWNFVLWGAFHGVFLVLDKLFLKSLLNRLGLFSVPVTFAIVLFSWVLFRLDNLNQVLSFWFVMVSPNFEVIPNLSSELLLVGSFSLLFSFLGMVPGILKWQEKFFQAPPKNVFSIILKTGTAILLVWLSASQLTAQSFNPFIYFRF